MTSEQRHKINFILKDRLPGWQVSTVFNTNHFMETGVKRLYIENKLTSTSVFFNFDDYKLVTYV